ncbi:MAG: hypothetical protein JNL83_21345 [Myxococcales bacterium]|nr:hypothetical protein [Myxococcales bacterium]
MILLDIDGVLTSFAMHEQLDAGRIALLDELVLEVSAELVLISSWRDRYGLSGTRERLSAAGLRSHLARVVPAYPSGSRSDEIRRFLAGYPRTTAFVILDDVLADPDLRGHQVLVDGFVGLQQSDLDRALRILRPV